MGFKLCIFSKVFTSRLCRRLIYLIFTITNFLGISEPRRSSFLLNGNAKAPLPNVRLLSNLLFREPAKPLTEVVALTSNWAFFIYTDLVHIGSSQLTVGMKRIFGVRTFGLQNIFF